MIQLLSPWSTGFTRSQPWQLNAAEIAAGGENPLNPDDPVWYADGEWLQDAPAPNLDHRLIRGGNFAQAVPGTPDDEGTVPAYQVFAERGRTDQVAMAGLGRGTGGKVTVIRVHAYEGITDVADLDGLAVGDALAVYDVAYGGRVVRGLAGLTAGYEIARVVSVNVTDGTVRFIVR